ncbi:transposase [Micromonospora sp. NPDC023633]|uniref:transposase n=1 Tax=Micromonospora sp. NPDC023633 TaxID=3154320 RepID=UPI0033D22238
MDASSGEQVRHRLSRAGNRQINRVLHIMATVQLRDPTEGRAYFDRKKASAKTSMEAMRALKRRLSDIVYRQMTDDTTTATATGPGGQRDSAPTVRLADTASRRRGRVPVQPVVPDLTGSTRITCGGTGRRVRRGGTRPRTCRGLAPCGSGPRRVP